MLFSHGFNKAFLVPDSWRVTVRNGNSISVDGRHRGHYLEHVLDFLTLQDKHNIHILSVNYKINLHSLCNSSEKLAKALVFLPEEIF